MVFKTFLNSTFNACSHAKINGTYTPYGVPYILYTHFKLCDIAGAAPNPTPIKLHCQGHVEVDIRRDEALVYSFRACIILS